MGYRAQAVAAGLVAQTQIGAGRASKAVGHPGGWRQPVLVRADGLGRTGQCGDDGHSSCAAVRPCHPGNAAGD